jgi:hypothetical protein
LGLGSGSGWVFSTACLSIALSSSLVLCGCFVCCHVAMDSMWGGSPLQPCGAVGRRQPGVDGPSIVDISINGGPAMAGGETKIKIKIGEVEIDYEGDAEFLKRGLLAVCQELSKLNEHIPAPRTPKPHKAHEGHGETKNAEKHFTVTIANQLGAHTAPIWLWWRRPTCILRKGNRSSSEHSQTRRANGFPSYRYADAERLQLILLTGLA